MKMVSMKHLCSLLTALFIFLNAPMARVYYVSSSYTGSTSNGNFSTPWKSLSIVQSNMSLINPGDTVSFKSGDLFVGTLTISRSGTVNAPIVFNAYGTGNKPIFSGTGNTINYLIYLYNRNYIIFDGWAITDPGLSPTDRWQLSRIQRAFGFDGTSTGNVIKNCSIELVGIGTYWVGPGNTMDHCDIGNLRMVVNNIGGDNDYGANPVVISSAGNTITSNYFHDCWANSYDYQYDGGAVEFYGSGSSNNFIAYNTFVDCNGVVENGSGNGGLIENNKFAYNKFVNNGSLFYINNSGSFQVSVQNMQFYNNVIIENTVNRLAESNMASMSVSVSASGIVVFKNNVFQLSNGVDVVRSGQWTSGQLIHENNVYKLSNNSLLNFSLSSNESSTSLPLWTDVSSANPLVWNFTPASGSLLVNFGQPLGLTRDFLGNGISGNPDAGIIERVNLNPLQVTVTYTAILCHGGNSTVNVSATGGLAPYTGIGVFSQTAGNGTYIVRDATGTLDTVSLNISQPDSISYTYTAGDITSFGGTTTLSIQAVGGVYPYTYQLDDGIIQSSNQFSGVSEGNHVLTIYDQHLCILRDTISIIQHVLSNLNLILIEKSDLSCRNSNDGRIKVSAVGGKAPYIFAINNSSYSTDSIFSSLTPGTYVVYVKDSYGQKAKLSIIIKNSKIRCSKKNMGLKTRQIIRNSLWAQIKPNPTQTSFNIKIDSDIEALIAIDVYDLIGKCVLHRNEMPESTIQFGSTWLPGIYFLHLLQDGISQSYKLVKQ